jgi:hypothetical protein
MRKKTVIPILIIIGLIALIWTPPFFEFYSFKDALIITISAIIGGYIAELLFKKK